MYKKNRLRQKRRPWRGRVCRSWAACCAVAGSRRPVAMPRRPLPFRRWPLPLPQPPGRVDAGRYAPSGLSLPHRCARGPLPLTSRGRLRRPAPIPARAQNRRPRSAAPPRCRAAQMLFPATSRQRSSVSVPFPVRTESVQPALFGFIPLTDNGFTVNTLLIFPPRKSGREINEVADL